jgi:predicted Zn-dependent protease with MMP-like domain
MTDEEFNDIVSQGIDALPAWVHQKLQNVAFLVKDEPSKKQRKEHALRKSETLFGLYEGVPLSERGNESVTYPDTITIFKDPILTAYTSRDDIRTCVANTIWHEVAHYFGHNETWVAEEEIKRGKTH